MADRGTGTRPPALRAGEFAGWVWRQLTSMRVALMLLFLLALAAIPGSVIPQRRVNPLEVADFIERNPELARWYDRFGLFDVFNSPWFAAIYIALMVSLVGCILPRSRDHWRAMRARPPRAPRRLERMPAYRRLVVDAPADEVLAAGHAELTARRYRTDTASDSVAGEAGHLRETGNLMFHLSLVIVLLAVALGSLFGYRGTVIVQERTGFANTLTQYDSLSAGTMFDARNLPPFALELDEFVWEVHESGPQRGAPADFEARVRFVPEPGAPEEHRSIRVNEPLEIDGTLIHILNPGYAPAITVRDANGEILAEGPVTFLPMDDNFTSEGVRKVPVADGDDIGIEAIFFPTALFDDGGASSAFAGPRNPMLLFTAFVGDLGINDGTAQSVFRLDTSEMEQLTADGAPFRAALAIGETVELPGGHGTVTFDGYVKWVQLQISRNSGKELALGGALLAVAGLVASLYVRRRRAWVRATEAGDGRTVVEVAGLARSGGGDLDEHIEAIADGLVARLPTPAAGLTVRQG
jgi:cytochrome c biogenesis protein